MKGTALCEFSYRNSLKSRKIALESMKQGVISRRSHDSPTLVGDDCSVSSFIQEFDFFPFAAVNLPRGSG